MKKLIPLAVLLVIVFIGAPYVTGKVAETQIAKIIEQAAHSPLSYGSNEILSYERGAFSSTSEYRYTLPLAYQSLTNLQSIDFQCDLEHGVIGIDYACTISDNPSYRELVDTYFAGKSPLSMTGNINAFGNISNTIAIDEINKLQLDSSDKLLSLASTTLTIDTDKDLQNYLISGASNGFSLTSGDETMSLNQVLVGGDLSKLGENLFVGDFDMDIDQIELISPDNEVNINGLQITTSAAENGPNLDSTMELLVSEMSLPEAQIKAIDALRFKTSVAGLNTEAFSEYQAFAKQMQDQALASDPSQPTTIDPMQMVPVFEKMLQPGFSFGVDTSGNVDGKANSFNFDIALLEALNMGDIMTMAIAPDSALGKFNLNVNSILDNPALPIYFYGNPLLKQSGEQYQFDLNIGDQVTLNGEEISMQELQSLIMSSAPQ